jgi:hypothetical protein
MGSSRKSKTKEGGAIRGGMERERERLTDDVCFSDIFYFSLYRPTEEYEERRERD